MKYKVGEGVALERLSLMRYGRITFDNEKACGIGYYIPEAKKALKKGG